MIIDMNNKSEGVMHVVAGKLSSPRSQFACRSSRQGSRSCSRGENDYAEAAIVAAVPWRRGSSGLTPFGKMLWPAVPGKPSMTG